MTQREKLIELLLSDPIRERDLDDDWGDGELDEIADHLLANGVIVPPCKVGDNIYYTPFGKTIKECIVHAVECEENKVVIKSHIWDKEREGLLHKHLVYFEDDDFGKIVFAEKAIAEKALAERSEGK